MVHNAVVDLIVKRGHGEDRIAKGLDRLARQEIHVHAIIGVGVDNADRLRTALFSYNP